MSIDEEVRQIRLLLWRHVVLSEPCPACGGKRIFVQYGNAERTTIQSQCVGCKQVIEEWGWG